MAARPVKHTRATPAQPASAPPRWIGHSIRAVRIAVFLAAMIVLCPIRFHAISHDLDPSWAYGLNYAHMKGLVWGRDIGFTYGPWAFLSIGMNVGGNLKSALLFQMLAWLALAPVLWWLIVSRKASTIGVLLFAFCLPSGHVALHSFGYAGLDHYFSILVVLLLACALFAGRWHLPFAAAVATAAVAAMIKFSAGVFSLGTLLCFCAAALLDDRRKAARAFAILGALFPVSLTAVYFMHHPSLRTMLAFLKTSMERSDAYSISNSLPSAAADLGRASYVAGLFLAFIIVLRLCRERSFYFALSLLAPWFFVFKHGFVRSDSHLGIFYSMGGMLWACVFLVTDFQRRNWWKYSIVIVPLAFSSGLAAWRAPVDAIVTEFRSKLEARSSEALGRKLDAQSSARTIDRLPEDLLARLQGASVTPFPWELSYAAANPINMKPMPMLQSYGADSAYLDEWNARMFDEPARQPEFILMEWRAIDNRQPLWDVPATTRAILRWYDCDSSYGERLLLRRRKNPRFTGLRPVAANQYAIGKPIPVPQTKNAVLGRVRMSLTLYGRLVKFLWKIPEVDAVMLTGRGEIWRHRIIPDVFSNVGPLGFTPASLSDLQDLAAGNRVNHPITHLFLTGPGARYYESRAGVEFYEAPELALATAPPEWERHREVKSGAEIDTWRIESVNGQDAAFARRVSASESDGFVRITGWAADQFGGGCASAVAMEVDGKMTQAVYGMPRPDLPLVLRGNRCAAAGFEWGLPAASLGKGEHVLLLKILSAKRDAWHTASHAVTLVLR